MFPSACFSSQDVQDVASNVFGPWRLLPSSLVVNYGQVRNAELPPFPQVLLLSVKSLKSSSCATRKGLRLLKNHTNITSPPTNYRRSSYREYGAGVQGCSFHPTTEAIKDPALSVLPSPFPYSHPASLALPSTEICISVSYAKSPDVCAPRSPFCTGHFMCSSAAGFPLFLQMFPFLTFRFDVK